MSDNAINMHSSWLEKIQGEFAKDYMQSLREFLVAEKKQHRVIYPHSKHTFAAFDITPFDDIKVVILGQDPYHGPGQAHGLCFSVPESIPLPPSLVNIYKEIQSDLDITMSNRGLLVPWAKQGVFLLNSTLTVVARQAGSHQGKGWEAFTDKAIALLNEQREHLVFMLWGSYAQKKGAFIDLSKHLVLKAPHPSPLSAHRGFFGCKHFSKANAYLEQHGQTAIDWTI